jgi:hypothetical protein
MSWKNKYFYKFRDINDVGYVVNIMHNITGTTAESEIRGDKPPLVITYPAFERFAPVRGSGAALSVVSETDRQHLNLYTSDIFGYQVKVEAKNKFSINAVYSNTSTPPPITVGVNYYVESGNVVIYDDGSLAAIYNVGDTFPYLTSTRDMPDLFTMDFNSAVLTSGTIYSVDGSFTNSTCPPNLPFNSYIVESGTVAVLDDGSLAALYSAGDTFAYSTSTSQLPALMVMVFTDAVFSIPPKTIWHGYLDAELYSEPFNDINNYTVSLSANDGMAMLERILYLDALGNHYTGITTQWDAISAILLKLGIPWNNMYVKVSTTSPEVNFGTGETIFHQTWMRNDNWYDEDGKPFTCRRVLEETLRPYGAFLMITDNDVYITDFNSILLGASAYYHYNGTTLAYEGTTNINMLIGDLSDIGFASATQNFEILSGKNRQVVRYSPYRKIRLLDFNASTDNFAEDQTYGTTEFGTAPYGWQETWYTESDTWNRFSVGEFVYMEGLDDNDGEQDYYLKIIPTQTNGSNFDTVFFEMKTDPDFVISGKLLPSHPRVSPHPEYMYFLKVNAKAYVRFLENMNDTDHPSDAGCYTLVLNTRMSIGNQKAVSHGVYAHLWHPMNDPIDFRLYFTIGVKDGKSFTNFSPIDDKWVDLNDAIAYRFTIADVDMALWGMTGGTFNFDIRGFEVWGSGGEDDPNNEIIYQQVKDIRLKDIALTIVDKYGVELSMADTEYVAYMNPEFKDEGEVITTYLGENIKDYPTERGALMATTGTTFFNLHSWTKEGATDNLESLLLRSIQTNYQYPTYQLTMTTNQIRRIIGYVTYDHYLQQIFQITGAEHNMEESTTSLTISETYSDDLTINPLNY